MGRIYAIPYNGTITAAGTDTDLLSVQPASNKPVKLRGFRISQFSEIGDAQEESIRITVRRMGATFTVGSGGASVTAATPPSDSADTAWGFTARCNDTTVATTSGTNQVLEEIGWNERNTPCDFWYPDVQFCPKAKNGEAIVIRMETTLADDISGAFTFWVEEE